MSKVVAAGDCFNTQTNRASAVAFAYRQLDELEEAGIEFWYLQGQHCADDPPWFAGHRNAFHLHKQITQIGPHQAYGLDFQPYGKLQEELAEIPESCEMLVAHQTWGDWMGDIAVPQGEFAQLPGHLTEMYTGDLHQWKLEIARNADGEQIVVCSSGAIAMQKIDEPHEHYFVIMGSDGVSKQKTLKSRQFLEWPLIVTQEDLTKFMENIEESLAVMAQRAASLDMPEEMCKPRLRICYSHRIPETVRRVTKIVQDRAILHWKEFPPEEKQASSGKPNKAKGGVAVTPLSCLKEAIDKDEDPDGWELATRLLQATNSEEEFHKWWAEQMGETK